MQMAGNSTAHGFAEKSGSPSLSIWPQDGVGGMMPTPRNDSVASPRIAPGTANAAVTMRGASAFGSRCFAMILLGLAPTDRAASTNSRSLSASTCPRVSRATPTQPTIAIATKISIRPSRILPNGLLRYLDRVIWREHRREGRDDERRGDDNEATDCGLVPHESVERVPPKGALLAHKDVEFGGALLCGARGGHYFATLIRGSSIPYTRSTDRFATTMNNAYISVVAMITGYSSARMLRTY